MNLPKTIFKILIVLLFLTQNSFAGSTPIPGIGIVVKKNPGSGSISVPTGKGGDFSTQLDEGVYELSFPQDQLQISINSIVKVDYPKSSYQYDGSGVELVLEKSKIIINSKATKGNLFAIDKQNSSIIITVPKGGATLSGKLSWNDAVMTNLRTCPDGFLIQNGECVPINNSGNQQARIEGKTKGKIKDPGPKSPMITAGNSENCCGSSLTVSLNANGGTSSSAGVDNGLSFNPSLGIAMHWKNFGIGLDVGTFNTKANFDFEGYAAPLQNFDFLTLTNTKNNWSSIYFLFGPQYAIPLSPSQKTESGRHTPFHNKLTFTIALKGGLTINKTPEFSVIDNSSPAKNIASYAAPQGYKTNAFSLKPSFGFEYWINENFALTANAQYMIQTGQKEFITGYKDLTNVDFSNIQKAQEQINAAPKILTNTKGPENYMSFGFGMTYSLRKGWDGSIKGNKAVENINNETQRKGWDGSIKGKSLAEKGITENGLKKSDIKNVSNEVGVNTIARTALTGNTANQKQRPCDCCHEIHGRGRCPKGCDMATSANTIDDKDLVLSDSGKDIKNVSNEVGVDAIAKTASTGNTANQKQRPCDCCHEIHGRGRCPKGCDMATSTNTIDDKDLVLSDSGKDIKNLLNKADVKVISQILANFRKGWDGSIKGKNIENSSNADVKTFAETLFNLARKGWDGSIKGNKVENIANVKAIEETLDNIRKGWDGSIKGNKVKNTANEADVKAITETLVNLRKGWDGSIKGGKN